MTCKTDVSLFVEMLRIRMVEEAIVAHYPEQQMRCPVHLSIGQEAIAVGVCKAALHSDFLVSNHRAHAHYLAKGGDLKAMIAEIYGKETGCSKGRGGSMHLVDLSVGMLGSTPIVGGSLPVGVGVAFTSKLRQEAAVTLIFFGEGSTEEGVFAECLNFASLKQLPILFICENNLYSVYSPLSVRQSPLRDRPAIARAHGIPAKTGNGNNVEEVHTLALDAIAAIRQGNGPIYLEFETYRHREHCGPNFDNHIGYRTEEEFAEWEQNDPLTHAPDLEPYRAAIVAEIEEAFAFAKRSPFPRAHA